MGIIDRFLLGALLQVSAVTYYDLATRVSYMLFQLSTRFFLPVYPASAELHAKHDTPRLRSLFFKGMKVGVVMTLPVALAFILWSKPLIQHWLGSGYDLTSACLRVLAVNYAVWGLSVVPSAIMYGLNKPGVLVVEGVLRVILNAILSFLFISRMGMIGAAYGVTLATLITALSFLILKGKILQISAVQLGREVFMIPALSIVTAIFLFHVRHFLKIPVILLYGLFTAAFLYVSYVFYLGKETTRHLLRSVLSVR